MSSDIEQKITDLERTAAAFRAWTTASAAPGGRPDLVSVKLARQIGEQLDRVAGAVAALRQSFFVMSVAAPDIVDMRVRLEGESGTLAAALRAIAKKIRPRKNRKRKRGDLRAHEPTPIELHFSEALRELRTAAHRVASAVFPGAALGLDAVNRKIWDLLPIQAAYNRELQSVIQRGALRDNQLDRVRREFDRAYADFEAVDAALNGIALDRVGDAGATRGLIRRLRRSMRRRATILRRLEAETTSTFRAFEALLKRSARLAAGVEKRLSKLIVPAFPAHADLEQLGAVVDRPLYEALGGVERFALLNVASRMRHVPAFDATLLDGQRFGLRVFQALPDRVYAEANEEFVDAVIALAEQGSFREAPAGLHEFDERSFKQEEQAEGNLQVSYAHRDGVVKVDADIDLYRDPLAHLFGEVLINHLTGEKTNQFKVRQILDSQGVEPIGGFQLVSDS